MKQAAYNDNTTPPTEEEEEEEQEERRKEDKEVTCFYAFYALAACDVNLLKIAGKKPETI